MKYARSFADFMQHKSCVLYYWYWNGYQTADHSVITSIYQFINSSKIRSKTEQYEPLQWQNQVNNFDVTVTGQKGQPLSTCNWPPYNLVNSHKTQIQTNVSKTSFPLVESYSNVFIRSVCHSLIASLKCITGNYSNNGINHLLLAFIPFYSQFTGSSLFFSISLQKNLENSYFNINCSFYYSFLQTTPPLYSFIPSLFMRLFDVFLCIHLLLSVWWMDATPVSWLYTK